MARRRRWTMVSPALGVALAAGMALGTPPAVAAPSPSDGGTALSAALARVPATADALGSPIGYVDYRAVEASRAGAAAPGSMPELLGLGDDPAARRWFAAARGIASGPTDLVVDLLASGADWPMTVGIDFFDIDRAVTFGMPPGDGLVLLGSFSPDVIGSALAARGFTSTTVAGHTLWCGQGGCDSGLRVDLANVDRADPFGGRLGRQQPLAVSDGELLSSADITTVEAMLAVAAGSSSVADRPEYRILAAAAPEAPLIQATLVPLAALAVAAAPAIELGASPEEIEALIAESAGLEPLPVPGALAILDGATGTEQVVGLVLAYPDEAAAGIAAETLPRRLETVRSVTRDVPLAELLAERGLTSVATRVVTGDPSGQTPAWSAAVVELRAPLAADGDTPSSQLYRLFVDLLYRRDLLWLAPGSPGAEPSG